MHFIPVDVLTLLEVFRVDFFFTAIFCSPWNVTEVIRALHLNSPQGSGSFCAPQRQSRDTTIPSGRHSDYNYMWLCQTNFARRQNADGGDSQAISSHHLKLVAGPESALSEQNRLLCPSVRIVFCHR